MNNQARITNLKKHLEHLFPGKWVSGQPQTKTLLTGIPEIDGALLRGIARQRITEWTGTLSSGKTTILRSAISHWLSNGFHIAYVDTGNKLRAADWTFPTTQSTAPGKFWVIRPNENGNSSDLRNALWAADQLIRCQSFDVVILDLDSIKTPYQTQKEDRFYARLQTSLAQSNTSLLILKTAGSHDAGGRCYARLNFHWQHSPRYQSGFGGITIILPSVVCSIWKGGLSKTVEVSPTHHASNRLFTHSPVPDRRTAKS